MKKILITGSGGPLGVNVTRSLKMAPEIFKLFGTECNMYHLPLSLTDETSLIPHASDESRYLSDINSILDSNKIDLIIPTHPLELKVLGANRNKIKAKTFLPSQKSIELGNDKLLSQKLWEKNGIPVPKTLHINKEKDVDEAFNILGEKVWVRGSGTPGQGIGGRALLCESPEQAKSWIDYWKGYGGFICCEYLPGDNMTWTSLWKNGELVTSQGRQRLEYVLPHVSQSGITGAPAVSKTVSDKDLNEISEKAVKAIDEKPNGTYFVDLKKSEKGKLNITEINSGRFGTTIHFYTEAGVNYPHLYVKLAFGEDIAGIAKYNSLPQGLYWIRTLDCGPALVHEKELKL